MVHIIKNNLLELHTTPWGASMTALHLNDRSGRRINVIYGYKNEDNYRGNPNFMGATCGRYAGRIGGNAFSLNHEHYTLESVGKVHLHGGKRSLGLRKWTLKKISIGAHPEIVYCIKSVHLDGGYPGNLEVEARYTLEENHLKIHYKAWTDRDTYLNLTNHNYYNLEGGGNVRSHRLFVNADTRLETDSLLLPTGKVLSLEGSPLDHRTEKLLNKTLSQVAMDHTFVLRPQAGPAAKLYAPSSGIEMSLYTNQPSLVIYTPKDLKGDFGNTVPEKFSSICLEAQNFANAPNQPDFPSALLKEGETYRNDIHLEFILR